MQKSFVLFLPYHLLEKLHLLIRRCPFDPKKGVTFSHPKLSTRASTLGKDNLFGASSGLPVEVGRAVQLLDIRKDLVPHSSVAVIINPRSDEF